MDAWGWIKRALLFNLASVLICGRIDAQTVHSGAIHGTIRYTGLVPPSERIRLTDGQVLLHNDIVVDGKTKGLRHVAVVLDWKSKAPVDANAKPLVVDQREQVFVPRVVTVQEGRKIRFENNDLFNHGVSAVSILPENTFNVTTPAGQPYEHAFKAQKNPIPIGCALHAWMRAWVIVVPHPYHAVTDAQGKFLIDKVPPGKHTLLLTHPDTNYRERVAIEVHAGRIAEVAIEWKSLRK